MHQNEVQILYIRKKRDAVIKQATGKAVADALDAAERNHQQALKMQATVEKISGRNDYQNKN